MVAIFTGAGTGFERGSGSVLGGAGLLGSASHGRGGEGVFVNAASGNLVLTRQDEFLVGRGHDVAIARTYNSQATLADDNNDKWRQSTDRRVFGLTGTLNAAGSTVRRVSGDGSEIVYTWDATKSAYVGTDGAGAHDRITNNGAGQWVWVDGDSQTIERYTEAGGRIAQIVDTDGNTISFAYVGDKLDLVTTADGSWMQYSWSGNNISKIVTGYTDLATSTAKTLTRTWYEYTSNRLTKVRTDLTPDDNAQPTDAQSYWTSYTYDANGRVASVAQKDGSLVAIAYDGSGRVLTLTETASSGVTRVTTLAYGTGYTNVTDPTGQVTRLDHDAAGNLTKITAPPAFSGAAQQIVQFAYNATGDLISTTDALGNASTFTHANGNILTATDREGKVVTRTYGLKNELVSETRSASDASGANVSITTRYVYDAENHLRYAVTGEGRVTEYVYTGVGQLQSTVEYPEHGYPIGSGALTEATMNAWRDAIADRQSVKVTTHSYNARGSLTATIVYGSATTAGVGSTAEGHLRTYYTYNQAGQLLSRYNEFQNTETFVYDGLGRTIASTDVNGGTTTIVFNDTASTTTITLASGYVVTETYNLAGELINRTDSGSYVQGGTSANAYDKLGRLRVATNAAGGKTYTIYDKAGRKVGDVNHLGDLVEYRYDANDRIVAMVRYATRLTTAQLTGTLANPDSVFDISTIRPAADAADQWSWSVYDKEGRVVSAIGGDGSVTTYAYDASGRLVTTTGYVNKLAAATITGYKTTAPTTVALPATNAGDSVARVFYDRDGKLLGKLDGEGYLTRTVYDKAGQKVAEAAYAGATTAGLRAAGSFDQLVASVGTSAHDRWTRYVYDGAGLLRYSIDGLRQTTGYAYNKAGQVLEQTRYATAMAATADYTYDNVKALIAPQVGNAANRSTWSVYDTAGRLAYSVDPEGAVTGFAYDNRGQVTRTVQYATKRTGASPNFATMESWSSTNIGNAANRITRTWYTARGEARFTVDPEGYISRSDYDAEGRQVAVYRWDNRVTATDSTTIAQAEAASLGAGGYTGRTFTYLPDGRLHYETDGIGVATLYDYYANGLVMSRYEAYGTADQVRTHYLYDGAGRVTHQYDAYGTTEQGLTQFAYDGLGNRTSMINALGKTTSFTFDKTGRTKTVVNAAGTTSSQYNAFGDTTTATDARTIATTYTHDVLGRVKTVTDALSGVVSYDYNRFGEVWKTDRKGAVTYNWHDKLGRITHVRDAENYLTQTSYTTFGEVASMTRRFNPVTGTAVVDTPASVTANSGEDATTSFVYDKLGRVLTTTDALGYFETYTYNSLGSRVTRTAKSSTTAVVAGATTNYAYNRRGELLTETLPMTTHDSAGTQTSTTVVNRYEYDLRGNRTKQVEADNLAYKRTTTYIFDKRDRLTETRGDAVSVIADNLVSTSSVTPTEIVKYDALGNVIETVDAGGARTLFYYDDVNRKTAQIRQTSATANTYSTFAYDANGNVLTTRVYSGSVTLPGAAGGTPPSPAGSYRETTFTYDSLNRMLTSQVSNIVTGTYAGGYAAANLVTSYLYDARGNVVRLTDPNGGLTYSWYDKLDRKTAQLDTEGYLTTWAYDPDGYVTSERRHATKFTGTVSLTAPPAPGTVAADRVTQYGYDKAGNRTSEARLSVEAYAINASTGVLTTAATTATVSFLYNGLGQVVRKTEATGEQTNYAYDGTGRLSTETRAAFTDFNNQSVSPTTQHYYTGLGELSRTVQSGATNAPARTTTYAYGAGGRRTSITDAAGFTRSYAYDALGRVKKESYTRATAAGGTVTDAIATRYDLAGRAIFQGVARLDGSAFTVLDYSESQYNAYGEVWKQGVNGLWQTENVYDNAGRVTATNGGDGIWKFLGYDRNGNQTVAITSAGTSLTGQSFTGALALVGQATVNATYTVYDKRNLATQVIEEGRQRNSGAAEQYTTSRTYNAFLQAATETNALGATVTYTYNTLGRVTKLESPLAWVTLENGTAVEHRPTLDQYYDLGGRLIGARDANGNLTTQTLLAGTGYGGSAGLVVAAFQPDTGKVTNSYDIHGDVRRITDQLNRVTNQTFDAMGRVTEVSRFGGLIESYAYDGLGQRIQAWNNLFQSPIYGPPEQIWVEDPPYWNQYDMAWEYPGTGHWETYTPIIGYAPEKALTEYDSLGRVTSQLAFGGDLTTMSYVWSGSIATSGLGTFGGWTQTTTFANSRTLVEVSDTFGRATGKTDLGGHVWSYSYDVAGRMTQTGTGGSLTHFTYYNTGLLASTIVGEPNPQVNTNWSRTISSYTYDKLGQKLTEQTNEEYGYYTPGQWIDEYDPYWGYIINSYWQEESYSTYSYSIQSATTTYDALGRLKTFVEAGSTYSPAANIAYEYDKNGNVRRTTATYRTLNNQGVASATSTTSDYWYRYDSMNRVVTDRGVLRGGQIVRGETSYGTGAGQDIQYNLAGDRVAVLRTDYSPGWYDYEWGYYYAGTYAESRESYVYNSAGRLFEVQLSGGIGVEEVYNPSTGYYDPPTSIPAAPVTGTVRSRFYYDLLGRTTSQSDYEWNGTTVAFSRTATYNNKGQLTYESASTKKTDGYVWLSNSTYNYGTGTGYALGSALSISTKNYRSGNDNNAPDTLTTNTYQWWDGAVQATITHKPNTSQTTTYTTTFAYNGFGQLSSIYVGDGRPRSISFRLNAEGQIVRRDESDNNYNASTGGDPHEVWYRFNGRQLGYIGNNGTSDVNVATSISERQQQSPTTPGAFRGGSNYGSSYADFANSYDPINSYSQGSGGGNYTVRAGDTLQSIAQNVWGDASLWYKIAEANGLTGEAALAEGRTLILPAGVLKSAHNVGTFKPYDASEAIGDVSPTTPKPQNPKKNKCGVFGIILLAVIAIAVTIVTAGAALAAVGAASSVGAGIGTVVAGGVVGALGGGVAGVMGAVAIGAGAAAVGSIVSQGIGVATGIQDKFSWKAVGMAAIGGAVGAGISGSGVFNGLNGVVRAGVSAMASSAITQGIGVATGLQDKFSWVGVAAAGVGAMAAHSVFGDLPSISEDNSIGNYVAQFGKSTVNALANAATRSALEGSNFGDNVAAAMPDVIAQTIGDLMFNGVSAPRRGAAGQPSAQVTVVPTDQTSAPPTTGAEAESYIASVNTANPGTIPGFGTDGKPINDSAATTAAAATIVSAYEAKGSPTGSGSGRIWVEGTEDGVTYGSWVGGEHTVPLTVGMAQAFNYKGYTGFFDNYTGGNYDGVGAMIVRETSGDGANLLTNTFIILGDLTQRGSSAAPIVAANIYWNSPAAADARAAASLTGGGQDRYMRAFDYGQVWRTMPAPTSGGGTVNSGGNDINWGGVLNTGAEIFVPGYGSGMSSYEAYQNGNYWAAAGWGLLAIGEIGLTIFTLGGSAVVTTTIRGGTRLAIRGASRADDLLAMGARVDDLGEFRRADGFTFRGDARSADEIFNNGFSPRGDSMDLLAHARNNMDPPSGFVSTSRSADVAEDFARMSGSENVYVVRPRNGIDVNATLGRNSPFPNEVEVAIPGRVLPSDVRAVTLTRQGVSILNPNWRP